MSESRTAKNPGWHASQADHFKSIFDYLKHVSTLATGSILLIATFLEKIFKTPVLPGAVSWSVGALIVSLMASLVAYGILIINFPRADIDPTEHPTESWGKYWVAFGIIVSWLSFLIGIIAMAAFFLANWNRAP